MQFIIDLTLEQEAALKLIAAKGNKPATAETPEVIIDPEQYFQRRINDMLSSYVEQTRSEEAEVLSAAFKGASETDRDAAFAALKVPRSRITTEAE